MRPGRHSSVEPAPAAESLRDLMRWPQWILWRLIGFPLPPIDSSSSSITSSQAASPPSKRQKKRGKHDVTDDSLMVWQRTVTSQANARRGLRGSTDYSGVDTPKWCFAAVEPFPRQAYPEGCGQFTFVRSCDFGVHQRLVLQSAGQIEGTCHSGNMIGRLPLHARKLICEALPHQDATLEERVTQHRWIQDWLIANRQWVFTKDAQCWCQVHRKMCYAHPAMYLQSVLGPNADRPLLCNVAGVTCKAWSAEGSREGDGHESCVYNAIWLAERMRLAELQAEDCAWFERTALYPILEKLVRPLERNGTHLVIWLKTNPIWIGFPSVRHRVLAFALNTLTMKWTGPTEQAEIEEDFARCFNRHLGVGGAALTCQPEDARWEHIHQMAKHRGSCLTLEELKNLSMTELLMRIGPAGLVQRKREWQEECELTGGLPGFLADLDHHPGHGNKAPNLDGCYPFPLQLTHGLIAEFCTGREKGNIRVATPWEHLVAHGFHATSDVTEDCGICPLSSILASFCFKPTELKQLSGNGMNLVTQTAFMLWCLSNCVAVDDNAPQDDGAGAGEDDW